MSLFELCIRRPVLSTVLSLLVLVIGLISYSRLAVREYPKIDEPIVSVSTTYPGASADVIESQITKVLEDSLAGIEGVELLTSSSRSERSNINVRFRITRDPDSAAADVRDKVARVRARLPDNVDEPVIAKVEADSFPVIWMAVTAGNKHAAGGFRLPEPLRQAAPVGAARCRRRLDLRRAQDVDAHQRRPRPARRLQADAGRRRGRAAPPEHRAAVGPHRVRPARVPDRRGHRRQHARAVREPDRRGLQRLSGAPARRRRGRGRPGRRARHRALPRRTLGQHGPGQAGHRQSARTVACAAGRGRQDQRDAAGRA